MSSILEALKELESERARGAKKSTSVIDVPSAPPRAFGLLLPLAGGLALVVVALGMYFWSASAGPQQPIETASLEQPARSVPEQAPAPARGPEWLGRVEPPRARVAPATAQAPAAVPAPAERAELADPVVAPAPTAAAVAPPPVERAVVPASVQRAAAPTPPAPAPMPPPARAAAPAPPPPVASAPAPAPEAPVRPAPAKAAATPARRGGAQEVQMEALAFSSHVHQRTVTLLVDGRRATLHQGESLGGVEVQLIMADGAYLQRGGDVVFIGKPR